MSPKLAELRKDKLMMIFLNTDYWIQTTEQSFTLKNIIRRQILWKKKNLVLITALSVTIFLQWVVCIALQWSWTALKYYYEIGIHKSGA